MRGPCRGCASFSWSRNRAQLSSRAQGYGAVSPRQGLAVLQQLLRKATSAPAAVTVNPFDWGLFLAGAVRSAVALCSRLQQMGRPRNAAFEFACTRTSCRSAS